ncbi:MAG: beta-ketoacyl synthase chain length factor [Acidibrevibacterium sp.]|jgi:hypothetical protein|uniref:beta-ketoacyl synthase chain length factor n=1 Tax=Acidibrevibacterium fodinaquatile TaxID=1969806 RepID=UPI000E0CDB46|nr:beta-ketoacyl synthase chain length factor [Acidibrevibacterium fodinaquatile]MCA7120773.1 beta-ketoacyl synthase chain length factor [Acidibrevibacterium fodinaquatile]
MLRARIFGIGLWGPGLPGWSASRGTLAGAAPLIAEAQAPPAPTLLPANERRRAGPAVRLALTVADAAVAMAREADPALDPARLRAVFASSNGEGAVVDDLLKTLADPTEPLGVSPTQFHNSVHNVAAGYWSIAQGGRAPADSLAAHDTTFAAGLLKALAETVAEAAPVLFCLFDAPLPFPLSRCRRTDFAFAMALVLAPDLPGAGACARIAARFEASEAALARPRAPALAALVEGNPAAQSLALLETLARGERRRLAAPLLCGHLAFEVTP